MCVLADKLFTVISLCHCSLSNKMSWTVDIPDCLHVEANTKRRVGSNGKHFLGINSNPITTNENFYFIFACQFVWSYCIPDIFSTISSSSCLNLLSLNIFCFLQNFFGPLPTFSSVNPKSTISKFEIFYLILRFIFI